MAYLRLTCNRFFRRTGVLLAAAALLTLGTTALSAAPIGTYTATGVNGVTNTNLNATAVFDQTGNIFTITLTSTTAAKAPSDVLTALFWDLSGSPSLTGFNALTAVGSCVTGATCPPAQDLDTVNGNPTEWGFSQSITAPKPPLTQNYGVGTAGLSVVPGFNLGGSQQLDYGIIGSVGAGANSAITGGTFVVNSMVFSFTLPNSNPVSVSNVRFQFGTALNEPSVTCTNPNGCTTENLNPVPEPMSMGLMGAGLIGLAMLRGFRRK
jgi:hypothetical protein